LVDWEQDPIWALEEPQRCLEVLRQHWLPRWPAPPSEILEEWRRNPDAFLANSPSPCAIPPLTTHDAYYGPGRAPFSCWRSTTRPSLPLVGWLVRLPRDVFDASVSSAW
jgi:hypothetical protein